MLHLQINSTLLGILRDTCILLMGVKTAKGSTLRVEAEWLAKTHFVLFFFFSVHRRRADLHRGLLQGWPETGQKQRGLLVHPAHLWIQHVHVSKHHLADFYLPPGSSKSYLLSYDLLDTEERGWNVCRSHTREDFTPLPEIARHIIHFRCEQETLTMVA